MTKHQSTYDVVIAGAGPVGLFLACELRLAGATVLVLERAETPDSPSKRLPFGMRGLSAPTIESFYRRGLLDQLRSSPHSGQPTGPDHATAADHPRRAAGHFAGIPFFYDKIGAKRWRHRLPGATATNMATTIDHLESILAKRAMAMGVEIEHGLEVHGIEQSAVGVTVRAGHQMLHGRWLVGCDGGRSAVRKMGGFQFQGTDPEFTGYSIEAELADPDRLAEGRHYTAEGMYTYHKPGTIAMVDFDDGAFHRSAPITLEQVQRVLCRISGAHVTLIALHSATTWTDRAFQATTYRNQRVLLAGDAAHIHSPLGGQGLNLGLGDATNLGWKLAATLRGDAPAGLLDSYTVERHPVGAKVLDWSRAQVAIMRPSRSSRALEAILRDLLETPDAATYFAERVWGLDLRYDLGNHHALVGCSAPNFDLGNGMKLGDHLRTGKGLLLDFNTASPLQQLQRPFALWMEYVATENKEPFGVAAVLVRPDGIVAWVAEGMTGYAGFTEAASRWFGQT